MIMLKDNYEIFNINLRFSLNIKIIIIMLIPFNILINPKINILFLY